MLDALMDAAIDTVKLFPILFITYILMEWLEHRAKDKSLKIVRYAGKTGPLFGGLFGAIPQCGFSGAAASFFAAKSITLGSLIAIFLATSDEMLPILISSNLQAGFIVKILTAKCITGVAFGYLIDIIYHRHPKIEANHIHDFCEQEHCDCDHGLLKPALKHTLNIILLIFIVSLCLNIFFVVAGNDVLTSLFAGKPVVSGLLAGVIGLIPNCSASVLITQLYVEGVMNIGTMMTGLLVNAGVGLLVLFKVNHSFKENVAITGILYVCGVIGGYILGLIL